jgi:hypothetical protein
MYKERDEIPEGELCKICGAPAVDWDDYYYRGYTCGQHPRDYTFSKRHVELMRMGQAFEEQAREQRRNFDPNGPYQPYLPPTPPVPSSELAALEKLGDVLPYEVALDPDDGEAKGPNAGSANSGGG